MTPDYRFATPFRQTEGSAIRELFKYLARPGMISFAGGYPSPALFDAAGLDAAMEQARAATPGELLQYGATEGRPRLRELLCELSSHRGIASSRDELIVTTGSQQGLDLLIRALIEPGDAALVTRPAYPAALQSLRLAGARLESFSAESGAIDFDELERKLNAPARPKLIYCVPTFANPSGDTFTVEQRRRLIEVAVRHRVVLVEDDPYYELRFAGRPVPPLAALAGDIAGARDWVVYLSSLSKTVAPALRIGWMQAPREVLRRCVIAKQTADLCTSPWLQLVAENYLQAGALARHLPTIIAAYRQRCQAMLEALRTQLAHRLNVTAPEGGMFVWGSWQNGVDATALLQRAIEANVMFVPGTSFYADDANVSAVRFSFAMPTVDEIAEGVRRLREAYDHHAASMAA